MTKSFTSTRRPHGFSLVELMVALVIGLIISISVVQIFTANRATYQLDEGLARAQENGRFAMDFLTQDIRHAGYLGCKRDVTQFPFNYLVNPGTLRYAISGVAAFEYNASPTGPNDTYQSGPANNTTSGWAPALNTALAPEALPGTDVIAIQRMAPNTWTLVPPYVDKDNVYLNPAFKDQVQIGDILLVTDCREGAVFQVTGVSPTGVLSHATGSGQPGNRCGSWEANLAGSTNAAGNACTNVFDNPRQPPQLGKLETVVFYVANNATNEPTLYRNVTDPSGVRNTQPLVEGVESLQVLYGVDDVNPDGIADRFVTANNVSDFSKVVSVRIGVLVHGVNVTGQSTDTALDTDIYNVAGTNIDPPDDTRKRRVFGTTIQLRNRGL